MELKYKAKETSRFVTELRAGSVLTGARIGGIAGPIAERRILAAPRMTEYANPLQNALTGRRLFVIGLDAIGDLTAGTVELG